MDTSGIHANTNTSDMMQILKVWFSKAWDYTCPLFLQKRIYTPLWNKRRQTVIMNHIKKTRSNDGRERRSIFHAKDGQKKGDRILNSPKPPSFPMKLTLCSLVGIGSFLAVSPHYVQNFCVVFFGSIGMVRAIIEFITSIIIVLIVFVSSMTGNKYVAELHGNSSNIPS